ncbi:MAG: type II toxin-antitoxin system PemK/MazF family toxin [Candidatus Brocadia sp.]|jgi:Growth inhibitor|uniref:mRNA interferase n=1 Tax=Candidatus Brocadia fulgida TaxID=380242 RepID=A0A0M2UZ39_9BACT|nr:MAG: YdcE protein, chain A [Candidatus Brocadia fulgida]UJS21151.1 MAG: type II toxin-antitoxin system PemK/MazF family toxin [Candidatus Brocadia sp.]
MKQKEIWLINLDPSIGAEIKKTRPCVILNDDSIGVLPLKVVAPITDYKEKYEIVPWMVQLIPDKLNNLKKISVIDVFQVRSVSEKRLIRKLGVIREDDILKAKEALKLVFGL